MSHDYRAGLPGKDSAPEAGSADKQTSKAKAERPKAPVAAPAPLTPWEPVTRTPFSRRRLLKNLAKTVLPLLVIFGLIWGLKGFPGWQAKFELASQSTELLRGLFRADPAAFKELLDSPSSASTSFLTSDTATEVLGQNITVHAGPGDVTLIGESTAIVHATVTTDRGELPVNLEYGRGSGKSAAWEVHPLKLPAVAPSFALDGRSELQPSVQIYGRTLNVDNEAVSPALSLPSYYVWPGTVDVAFPAAPPAVWSTPQASYRFPFSLDGRNGAPSNYASPSLSLLVTPEFRTQVAQALTSSVKACASTTVAIPAACPLASTPQYDDPSKLRKVQRTVLRLPDVGTNATDDGLEIQPVAHFSDKFGYSDSSAIVLTKGERLKGGTWLAFQSVETVYARGTISYGDGKVTLVPNRDDLLMYGSYRTVTP